MDYFPLEIPDVKVLEPSRHQDSRGFFSEIYNRGEANRAGIKLDIVQENFSRTGAKNTIRGLHCQLPPFSQAKLVQVISGAIIDVAVDLRRGSPWFGKYVSAELSADNWRQLWIPQGFAHGFCTLEADTQVIYKVNAPYSSAHDSGIRWDDPELNIDWPVAAADVLLSEKDSVLPTLADFDTPFSYEDNGK